MKHFKLCHPFAFDRSLKLRAINKLFKQRKLTFPYKHVLRANFTIPKRATVLRSLVLRDLTTVSAMELFLQRKITRFMNAFEKYLCLVSKLIFIASYFKSEWNRKYRKASCSFGHQNMNTIWGIHLYL